MIARVVEMVVKPGASELLSEVIEQRALPLLRQCAGLHDYIVMVLKDEPRIVLIQSFWDRLEDIQQFERDVLPVILPLTRPYLVAEVRTRLFTVSCQAQTDPADRPSQRGALLSGKDGTPPQTAA